MKLFGTSLNLSKKHKQILAFLILFSFLMSFLLYQKLDSSLFLDNIINIEENLENHSVNLLFIHFLVLSVLITSSIMVIGLVLFPLYFLWELICICFSFFCFFQAFGVLGIVFGIFYNLIIKGIFLVSLFLIFKNIYFIIKHTLFNKSSENTFTFSKQYRVIFISVTVILLYDVFLYFLGNHILQWLCFIISS